MELRTKLKFCAAFSVLALIIKIVVFASPGWAIVKSHISDPVPKDEMVFENYPPKQRHGVSISFGMWYYKVCMCEEEMGDTDEEEKRHHHHKHHHHHHHKCYHGCYRKKRHQRIDFVGDDMNSAIQEDQVFENDIPEDFNVVSGFISTSVEFARHGRIELAAYTTIGLVLGLIGMIAAIVYSRGGGLGRHSGRVACSTQAISSFFYWMALVRVATIVVELRHAQKQNMMLESMGTDVSFPVPWCLILGAIGAIIMDVSALFHLIMISRDKKVPVTEYSVQTKKMGQSKIPIIAPKGYEQLLVPPMYSAEEADSLPEKQSIA